MPFAAPAIGAIAGGGSLLGGLLGGKKSKEEKELMRQQTELAKRQSARADEQFGIAKQQLPQFDKFMQQALQNYGVGQRYYGNIARGGESALDALLGPKRSEVNRAYQARVKNTEFMPRGGGRNAEFQNIDTARQGQLIDVALGARPEAIRGILGIGSQIQDVGSQYGNLALGFTGQGTQGLSSSSGTLASLLGSEQASQARRQSSLSDLGEGLGNIFFGIGNKKGWFKF